MNTFLYSRVGRLTKSLTLAFLIALLCLFSNRSDLLQDALPLLLLAGYYLITDRRFTVEQIQSAGLMVAHVGVYLLLCTLVIWATTGDEESVYWIVYFLPVSVAASNLNLRLTLLTCTSAGLLFFSQIPSKLYLDAAMRREELPELLVFIVTFFIVGLLVQSFSDLHRRQLRAQRELNEKLLANQAALQESLARLNAAEESLRRKERLAAIGEMSAGIAHEIRNPLGIISSSAELVEKRLVEAPADVQSLLGIIQEESTRINGLVSDFIAFGRPGTPVMKPHNLQALLLRAAEHIDGLARQRGIHVVVEPLSAALEVRVDADMMQQVLLNLLLNALEAVSGDGEIRLRGYAGGGRICFDVEDNGCGIPPEILGKIFDPFVTTRDKGTGLGLANAYRIVEAHGGDIRVNSAVGQGTVFTICLPGEVE